MPRLPAVLAGSDDAANRTTGSVDGDIAIAPGLGTAVAGGDEREEDWDESVPVDDLLLLCRIVPPDIFELIINCDAWEYPSDRNVGVDMPLALETCTGGSRPENGCG
jgi:hypothetical protein